MTVQESQSISDVEVIERIRGGEAAMYELIMRRYNQRLYRIVRSVVQDDREAEDVLQEAWVQIYEHLDQFAGLSSFPTWIGRIAFHGALSRARKAKRWQALEDETGVLNLIVRPSVYDHHRNAARNSALVDFAVVMLSGCEARSREIFID